ncbi:MAG TPA: universal stress protein [Stellaceae bacterium]|nr:universal stress protein [Stellaceae bacterium]
MSFKDILVIFTDEHHPAPRLKLAVDIAQREGAHLVGLYPISPITLLSGGLPYTGSVTEVQALELVQASKRSAAQAEAGRVEASFQDAASRAGLSSEWRCVEAHLAEAATLHARYCDLTVLGQSDPDHPVSGGSDLVESVLLGSGRPMLVVPYAGRFDQVGRNVLVAWNGTREAARALNDALPMMTRAEKVTVLSVNPSDGIGKETVWPGADIAHHLARHSIIAEASSTVSTEIDVGNAILSRAADLGSDLIVMGGYGHSRARELILGGVTRTLLQHMTVPVLLSH